MMNNTINLSNTITIGIDVSKERLDIFILPTGEILRVANDPKGFTKLYRTFSQYNNISRIVMEHTGGYQKQIAHYLMDKGLPVSVVNPAFPKFFAKSLGVRAKTDAKDAELLAHFGSIQKPFLSKSTDKTAELLKELVVRRNRLNALITQEKNTLEKNPSSVVVKSIHRSLKSLEKEKDFMEKEIQLLMETDNDLKQKSEILCKEKGIKTISAAALLAYLPELGTLGRRQIAALAGLAP